MKPTTLFLLVLFAASVAADTPVNSTPFGNTTILVQADIANGFVPPRMPSRVRVPPYETVTLAAPAEWPFAIEWRKDGKTLAGQTGRSLILPLITPDDAGEYSIGGAPFPYLTTPVKLDVVPEGNLGNLSNRSRLAPGDDVAIAGFVVTGHRAKPLLIRAVGPSLRGFGVTDPVAQPTLTIVDRQGRPVSFAHVATANYWTDLFAHCGAFPLDGGENSVEAGPFAPGVYSALARDAAGTGGTVLLEIYEIP